ncbi:MAG TPA: hypothetical protein VFZ59_16070 [Verrucomicrobiae bacterium]|nr:hypothetical protein [Verrucomicrobiae bacterium]
MSLINDALKRAQQTQQENPPPTPELVFRPVERNHAPRRTTLISVGVTLVIIALLGLTGLLIWYLRLPQSPLPVAARELNPSPTPQPPDQTPRTPAAPAVVSVTNSIGVVEPTGPTGLPTAPHTNSVPPATPPVAPVPPPFKLQGIFFNPKTPTAVINGTPLQLGEWLKDSQVTAISPVAVTLVSATATNVLSLSR